MKKGKKVNKKMSKELTIECPKCNHVFSADDAFAKSFKK